MRRASLSSPLSLILTAVLLGAGVAGLTAQAPLERLPADVLDAVPPSARVTGTPGSMRIRDDSCRSLPATDVRRRIVDLAVQEWAYFGFTIVDQAAAGDDEDDGFAGRRFRRRPNPAESARTAASIGGYWAVAPGGDWILESQNEIWKRPSNSSDRWRYPWSAAFISWVMCEGGLGLPGQFQRAIAHHTYIDQAIRARDGGAPDAAFVAYDTGEAAVSIGDLLCSARQPAYRTLAERRRQMGEGARTHCDVVVKVDPASGHLLAIGGNVRGSVSLKVLPAERYGDEWRPASSATASRPLFAHLRLRAAAAAPADAFDTSPTLRRLSCLGPSSVAAHRAAANLLAPAARRCVS